MSFVKCPCCLEEFHRSEILWIAEHEDLKDDYFKDRAERKRFLPERFSKNCQAYDERGEICKRDFACPHCHMEISEEYFNSKPMYVSLVGTNRSGKTYFLAALHHWLQQNRFIKDYRLDLSFSAALYASQNEILATNVDTLFRRFVPADAFARLYSTALDELEREVTFPDKGIYSVARPFTYVMRKDGERHALCFYDLSGETFFQQRIEEARNLFTRQILNSDILFFLYDPEQNENCVIDYARRNGRSIWHDGQINMDELVESEQIIASQNREIERTSHQVFHTMANFIREYANTKAGLIKEGRYTKYIYIIVTKCDAWKECLLPETQRYLGEPPNSDIIASVSNDVKRWLEQHDSAFTTAVSDFAEHYIYIPVSATGRQPKNKDGVWGYDIGVEPLSPRWVEVPFLCAMYPPQL